MIRVIFTRKEVKQLKQVLDSYEDDVRKKIIKTVEQTAHRVLRKADTLVPVDKGDLKRSGKVVKGDELYYKVSYTDLAAHFQEYGSINYPAQPYLTPAIESERAEFNNNVKKDLKK